MTRAGRWGPIVGGAYGGAVLDITAPGTPLATRVVLLGAGELAKEVVIALQRLGVEVTAVDRYDGAPAHQVAHHAVTAAMSDPAALRRVIEAEIARRPVSAERPLLVVPEIEALATDALLVIEAERDDVRVTPTARAAALTMEREGIRRLAAEELGVPTSPYRFCDSAEEVAAAAHALGYPCFVKPVVSSSGKGQSVVSGPDDVEGAWTLAMTGSRVERGRVIVEGAVCFDVEITLLTVRSGGADAGGATTTTSFCAPIGHRQEGGDYVESWQPQPLSAAALQRAQDLSTRVTAALGGWGVFGVELFVRGDEVWFSEVSPRPHDTGLVTLVTQHQSEFDLHARALLGLPVDTSLRCAGASAVIKDRREPSPSSEGEPPMMTGVERALAVPGADLRLFGKPATHPGRRLGVALARALPFDQPDEGDVLGRAGTGDARARASTAAAAVRLESPSV